MAATEEYIALVRNVLNRGDEKTTRQGGKVLSVFGANIRFPAGDLIVEDSGDLIIQDPAVIQCKLVATRVASAELAWMLRGETKVSSLQEEGVHIWDADAKRAKSDELGPIYGHQWAKQLPGVIEGIRTDPYARRHVVCSWNADDLPQMALPPCHFAFQFVCRQKNIDCVVTMRSADIGLGLPFNMFNYSLLLVLVAHEVGRTPGEVLINIGDAHIYQEHISQLRNMLFSKLRNHSSPITLTIPAKFAGVNKFATKVQDKESRVVLNGYTAPKIDLPLIA